MPLALPLPIASAVGAAGVALRRVFARTSVPAGLPECCPPPPPAPGWWERVRAAAALRRLLRDDPARYDTPWIALLGERGAGKSSLAASISARWRAHAAPTPQAIAGAPAQWNMYEMGALVDIDGALPQQAGKDWQRLLGELQDLRPERPLDGVVLALSARTLGGPAASLQESAANVRRQLDTLQQRLGFSLPVYLVVTQSDAVPGFAPFWTALPQAVRAEMFGWSCPALPDGGTPAEWTALAFAEAGQRLRALQVLAASGEAPIADADAFFLFPRHLAALRTPLAAWLEVVMQPSCRPGGYALRGIYFTGSVEAGGALLPPPRTDVAFVDDLALRKVLAERHLARPARRRIWSRDRYLRAAQFALGAAVLGLAAWFVGASLALARHAAQLLPALEAMRSNAALPQAEPCLPAARAYEVLALAERVQPSLDYAPWSWLDHRARNRSAAAIARDAIARSLLPAIRCRLAARSAELLRVDPPATPPLAPAAANDAARAGMFNWLDRLAQLELNAARLRAIAGNAAPADPQAAAEALLALLEYAYGQAPPRPAAAARPAPLQWAVAQLSRAGIPAAWFASPPARVDRDGALAQAMRQLRYQAPPVVTKEQHQVLQAHMQRLVADLDGQLQRDVGSGATLLDQLARLAGPGAAPGSASLPDTARKTQDWLAWVHASWLPSSDDHNPCQDVAVGLALRQATLAAYGYELAPGVFSAAACYRAAKHKLRTQAVPGYGPVISLQGNPARPVLNPALAREQEGLAALARQEFMLAAGSARFSCARATGWDTAALGRAIAYAREYQAFATKFISAGDAGSLFARTAQRQLQLAMDVAVDAAQQPDSGPPSALDGPDARMSAQSRAFADAMPALATVVTLYGQLHLADSASALNGCVRDQAAAALDQVRDLARQSQLYEPPAPSGNLLFAMGDAVTTDQFLARQVARVSVLAGYAEPYARYQQDSAGVADQHRQPSQLDPYWSNTIRELNQYVLASDSSGQVGKLHTLFSKVLPTLDTTNCRQQAPGRVDDGDHDLFAAHRRDVVELAASRCGSLGDTQLLADYRAFADHYDTLLAGRFPFGPPAAQDLPPEQARSFFTTYGTQLASLRGRASQRTEDRWRARRAFLDQLDSARVLLLDRLAGPVPVKLALTFNARPAAAAGASQIVNWTFASADHSTGWPNRTPATVGWSAGQAIALDLQWADRSAWRPFNDRGQYDLGVEGATASFAWGGDWALLRMLARHRPLDDAGDGAIELRVPIGPAQGGSQSGLARVYLGVAVRAPDPKTGTDTAVLVPASFPHFAPR